MSVAAVPARAAPISSSEEEYSSSDSDADSGEANVATPGCEVPEISDVELDWDTADEPAKEPEPIVRIRCVDQEVLDWDGLRDSDFVAVYGRNGFNRHINGIYQRQSPKLYKKQDDEIYIFQTTKWWRLSSRLDSESSLGYTRSENTPTPQLVLAPWAIFNETGKFEEDLNVRVRSFTDFAAANEFQMSTTRTRILSEYEKSLVTTLVNRGMTAKEIAHCTILNEAACNVVLAVAAKRSREQPVVKEDVVKGDVTGVNKDMNKGDAAKQTTGKTVDEVALAAGARVDGKEPVPTNDANVKAGNPEARSAVTMYE